MQERSINLFKVTGAIVFILWTMGKVPYHWAVWAIPVGFGCAVDMLTAWANRL